jgi:putative transposase
MEKTDANNAMPRRRRSDLPGYTHHVYQRGNNRVACFSRDADRVLYLALLEELAGKEGCAIHSYVLMTNHVHLLTTPERPGAISRLMQRLGQRYVQHFNRVHQRTGTLWDGRFKANVVDSDSYLLRCHRYIELNPVRAGMVTHPGDYRWSSYMANAEGSCSSLLTRHPRIEELGLEAATRQHAYRRLFHCALTETELFKIRTSCSAGVPLGSPEFVDAVERKTGHRPRGRRGSPG